MGRGYPFIAALAFVLAFWMRSASAEENLKQAPPWDGKETVADYAKRAGLEASKILDLGDGVKLEFVLVPPGTFTMGGPAGESKRPGDAEVEKPHKVTITQPYYLAKFELTQAQYEKVCGSNPSSKQDAAMPVSDVTWDDATAFCKKASALLKCSIDLPTEAQWEYACRAGTQTVFYTGNDDAALDKAGWYSANSGGRVHAGGEKAPNAFGLYDMLGNVRELCSDFFAPYEEKDATDPRGPENGEKHISRGGAYPAVMSAICRCASRTPEPLTRKNAIIGIRPLLRIAAAAANEPVTKPAGIAVIRSAKSGPWSDAQTWEGGKLPAVGNSVLVREGHKIIYDRSSDQAIRALFIAGQLSFATDRDTRLDVGIISVQNGEDTTEHGFSCKGPSPTSNTNKSMAVFEVGSAEAPVDSKFHAMIRLVYFEGMDPQSAPSIVCCGGRMDFQGAPLNRTWLKLGEDAKKGSADVVLSEPVTGWRKGDQVIVVGNVRQNKIAKTFVKPPGGVRDLTQTEERTIVAVNGSHITLDKPLEFDHAGSGDFRTEVANLSRNVVVESAEPEKMRGHTMYHRHSAGSISYAEFRHLGKEGVLGRYSLHFHLIGDTMRGSSVVGASIWDSGNRWITIHGTNYLVVRDCVGYNSIGHGFFLEDGTEQFNVLDRNLAVQARHGKILPDQVLPFDHNDGAGFWWGNCLNTFTRNVAAECDEYGYRFDMTKNDKFDPVLTVTQLDGTEKPVDVRTLPYVRFEDNEAHTQRRHAFNLGGFGSEGNINGPDSGKLGVGGVGPDGKHPYKLTNCRAWDVHWSLHTLSPYFVVDNFAVSNAEYGIWRTPTEHHIYHGMNFINVKEANFTGQGSVRDAGMPKDADPAAASLVDDMPPQTVITSISSAAGGNVLVRGTCSDNGTIKQVLVNGNAASALRPNFAEWELSCDAPADLTFTAAAQDAAGNAEKLAHVVKLAPSAAGKASSATDTPAPVLASGKSVEWVMEVGCQHCHFSEETGIKTCSQNCGAAGKYDGKVYFLKGATSKEFGKCGLWTIKGTLADDSKTINVSEMKFTALAAPDSEKSTAVTSKDKSPGQEWNGEVFHTGKFLPSLTVGAEKFGLKPAKDAPYAVKATLTQIGGGELSGKFKVSGTTYKDDARTWIVVEKIVKDK
jgi:formylglycine-generating enzyme required for sulfatase activity